MSMVAPERRAGNNAWYLHHTERLARELTPAACVAGEAAARRDVDFLLDQVPVRPNTPLLEIGCGWGRHTLALLQRGFHALTSIDISPLMLDLARERCLPFQERVKLVELDFLDVAAPANFGAVLSLYDRSCIGFPTEAADLRSLAHIAELLAPGGYFCFGTGDWPVNLPSPRRDWREWNGVVELLETVPDAAAMTCTDRTTVLRDGRREVYELTRRHYSLPEVRRLLGTAGFTVLGAWHGLDGRRPYLREEEGLFVLARLDGV